MVSAGDLTAPGRPLVRLSSATGRRVEAAPGEAEAARLSVGDAVPVVLGDRTVTGRVVEIVGAVDPETRRRIVRVDLPAGRRAAGRHLRAAASAGFVRAEAPGARARDRGAGRPRDRLGGRARRPGLAALRPDRGPGPASSRSVRAWKPANGSSSIRRRTSRPALERSRDARSADAPRARAGRLGVAGRLASAFIESKLTPLLVLFALALGALAIVVTPREEEPQIKVPMVDVFASLPGRSSVEVEREIIVAPREGLLVHPRRRVRLLDLFAGFGVRRRALPRGGGPGPRARAGARQARRARRRVAARPAAAARQAPLHRRRADLGADVLEPDAGRRDPAADRGGGRERDQERSRRCRTPP